MAHPYFRRKADPSKHSYLRRKPASELPEPAAEKVAKNRSKADKNREEAQSKSDKPEDSE